MFMSSPTRNLLLNHEIGLYSALVPTMNRSERVWLSYVFATAGMIVK